MIALSTVACGVSGSPAVSLDLTVAGRVFSATSTGFCNSADLQEECADTGELGPSASPRPTIDVEGGGRVTLTFHPQVTNFSVTLVPANTTVQVTSTGELAVPQDAGFYIYSVLASWSGGDAGFMFALQVAS
jgi:hypothetical protein